MTWDEIYERAEDTACGDWRLNAKDEARWQVKCLVLEKENYDIDKAEIPEDEVDYYCGLHDIKFDDYGNIDTYIWE
jgi:hypothetical protein